MAYLLTAVFVVVVVAAAGRIAHARRELRLVPRARSIAGRPAPRRQRLVAAGDRCVCGGVVGPSGRQSERFGPLLGCTACSRSWTLSGRRIARRRVPRAPAVR